MSPDKMKQMSTVVEINKNDIKNWNIFYLFILINGGIFAMNFWWMYDIWILN